MSVLHSIPLFLPGIVASAVIAVLICVHLAGWLGTHPLVAAVIAGGVGIIVSATLTPSPDALAFGQHSNGLCDFSRIGPASLRELTSVNDISLNVLLFVPLGIGLAALPWRRRSAVLVAAAIALPVVIEIVQFVILPLDRACQSADVVDNLMGLFIGYLPGVLVRLGVHAWVLGE